MINLVSRQLRSAFRIAPTSVRWSSSESHKLIKHLEDWKKKLRKAGVGDIDFNLKCLVAHVLKKEFNTLDSYDKVNFNEEQLAEFNRLLEARCARMPLQYILGEVDFLDLTLKTAPTVFIPRPETEEFVRKVIEAYKDETSAIEMLEVGCGSGAMSLAILKALPNVTSTAIERSKLATSLAAENAHSLGLSERFKVFNHTMAEKEYMPAELADKRYDLIISNPPYVRSDEFQYLQPEVVAYENLNALDGGSDGLCIARLVFELASLHLRNGGKLWLELGSEHPPLVKSIMKMKYEGRLRYISAYKDQYKVERFVEIEKY